MSRTQVVTTQRLLAAPPQWRRRQFDTVFDPVSSEVLSAYASLHGQTDHHTLRGDFVDGRQQLCYALTMAGLAFQMASVPTDLTHTIRTAGPALAGNRTVTM